MNDLELIKDLSDLNQFRILLKINKELENQARRAFRLDKIFFVVLAFTLVSLTIVIIVNGFEPFTLFAFCFNFWNIFSQKKSLQSDKEIIAEMVKANEELQMTIDKMINGGA